MISAFAYVNSNDAPLYRAIMRIFLESKERFVIRLRWLDVFDGFRAAGFPGMVGTPDQTAVESALTQLCEWGNLQPHTDEASATYRMTTEGEAVERALALYDTHSGSESRLHCVGLAEIRPELQDLLQLTLQAEPDANTLHRNLTVLLALFEDLSATAQTFVDRLDRVHLPQLEARQLIDYSEWFSAELDREADGNGGIAETIRVLDQEGVERLLQTVAERSVRESVVCSQWLAHWERFRNWFVSRPGIPSNSTLLRERIASSLPGLLRIVSRSDDRRVQRIDRANDFRVLARWFAQAETDADAHVLWRAAFGLCSARHLRINDETLLDREAKDIPATASWLHAPPLKISSRRDYRGDSRTGGLSRIVDRSAEKEKLAAAIHEEAQRLLNAQRRFGTGSRIRLSDLKLLDADELELFLDLLGEAVSARVSPAEAVEILSGDGCLKVKLEPTGDRREALILTSEGMFSGPDQWISIERIAIPDAPEVVA